jgi:hypothetical protein
MVDYLEHGLSYHVAQELAADENNNGTATMQTRMERAFLMADIHARQAGILASGATVAVCLIKVIPILRASSLLLILHVVVVVRDQKMHLTTLFFCLFSLRERLIRTPVTQNFAYALLTWGIPELYWGNARDMVAAMIRYRRATQQQCD